MKIGKIEKLWLEMNEANAALEKAYAMPAFRGAEYKEACVQIAAANWRRRVAAWKAANDKLRARREDQGFRLTNRTFSTKAYPA